MIESLRRPQAYDHPVEEVEMLETLISWVLLAGPFAYKVKKPVALGFVDFSTADRRRWFCEEELRLNRRLASSLYLGLQAVHGPVEQARFSGTGPVIDWAVRMRRFPQEALAPAALAAGRVEPRHWRALADALVQFQDAAAVADPDHGPKEDFGTPSRIMADAQANLDELERFDEVRDRCAALREWTRHTGEQLRPVFDHRRRTGRVREGHGDLHLSNLILLDDRLTAFDCLEFNPELRWIDVINELSFLVMDLADHGCPLNGARLLNRWLDRTGDYAGLATWRWYMVYRALVRGKVTALRMRQSSGEEGSALRTSLDAYVDLAGSTVAAPPGQLIITHGVSGSGKSHWSRRMCEERGWIHLRSDAERKRLFGLWGNGADEGAPVRPDMYQPEVTERLYNKVLPELAALVVKAGYSVIVDATFLKRSHRQALSAVAARCGAPFHILECRADAALARERITQRQLRGGDPSDADASVLASQWSAVEPLDPEEKTHVIAAPDCDDDSPLPEIRASGAG